LNQKDKKKKVKKRYRDRERAGRKKEEGRRKKKKKEEEGREKKGWLGQKREKYIYIKSQKSIPAGLHIPAETSRNRPKFWPRWNMGVPRTGLHASTRFSIRSDRNGMEYTTLIFLVKLKTFLV
jgi:hypothetical protein